MLYIGETNHISAKQLGRPIQFFPPLKATCSISFVYTYYLFLLARSLCGSVSCRPRHHLATTHHLLLIWTTLGYSAVPKLSHHAVVAFALRSVCLLTCLPTYLSVYLSVKRVSEMRCCRPAVFSVPCCCLRPASSDLFAACFKLCVN